MKKTSVVIGLVFLSVGLCFAYLTYWSGNVIAKNESLIRDERIISDVVFYASPESLRVGDNIETMFNRLFNQADIINSESTCKDFNQDAFATFNQLPIRAYCRNIKNAFIKQVSPHPSYIFNVRAEKNKTFITGIFDPAGNPVEEAKIFFNPKLSFMIDKNGEIIEQIRQTLMLNKSHLETDLVKMSVISENGRINEPWFQGTDWIRLGSAVRQSFFKITGLGGSEHYQGATSLPEQYCKIVFLDSMDPPPSKNSLSDSANEEKSWFWKKIEKGLGFYSFIKRRIFSAFLAESLLLKFSKDEIILRSLNVTTYGSELTKFNSGKLNHSQQQKEVIRGPKTAGISLFNKRIEELTPIEQASLAVAPNNPLVLKILQKNPNKRTNAEQEKLDDLMATYLKRIRKMLVKYSEHLDAEGKPEFSAKYKAESEKIPENISKDEVSAKAEEFKKLLPSLIINEDDNPSVENLQLMERESLRNEIDEYIKRNDISYTDLKSNKVTVVTSTKGSLQKNIANRVEDEAGGIKKSFDVLLSPDSQAFKFEIMVETVLSDADGRVLAASSVRSDKGQVIPNRQYVSEKKYLCSTAKVIHTVAGLDSGAITLDTSVCANEARSPNKYVFDETQSNECITIGDGLRFSVNWSQIALRNKVGNDFALRAWEKATDEPIKYPENFNDWRGYDKDQWLYEQTRGLNAEPVSKSVMDAVGIFTLMANGGKRSKPGFINEVFIGENRFEPEVEQVQVFNAESVSAVSALLKENGKNIFGLGENSPSVKTGSMSDTYWNIVWSENFVLISRVVVMMPNDETKEKRLKELSQAIKKAKTSDEDNPKIKELESEQNVILTERKKLIDKFQETLKEKSKNILARDMIQPLNVKIVKYLNDKENLFRK